MTSRDLGRVEVEPFSGGEMWHVWNLTYGRHTDSGDMGYIHKTAEEFEAYSRGDVPRSLGKCQSLEAAVDLLRAAY